MRSLAGLFFCAFLPLTLLGAPPPAPSDAPDQPDRPKPTTQPKPPASTDRYGKTPRYFSINPGLMIQNPNLTIVGALGESDMSRASGFTGKWMLDLKSRDYKWSDRWGIHFIVHTQELEFDRQTIPAEGGSGGGSGSGGGGGGESRIGPLATAGTGDSTTVDSGTRMEGRWTYGVPAIYYRFGQGPHGARLGLGYGYGRVGLHGSFLLRSPVSELMVSRIFQAPRDQVLDEFSAYYLGSGIAKPGASDPVFVSLIADLKTGDNLRNLTLYMLARGWRPTTANLFFAFAFSLRFGTSGGISPLEGLGMGGLLQGFASLRADEVPVFRLFVEFPIYENISGYVNFANASFKVGALKYTLRTIDFAVTYRLSI